MDAHAQLAATINKTPCINAYVTVGPRDIGLTPYPSLHRGVASMWVANRTHVRHGVLMAADGIPEVSAKRCGEVISQIRTARSWSRAKVIARLCSEIDSDDPTYDVVGEAWLARLENGR